MASSINFKNSSITVSQVTPEEQGQGIWEIKDWNKNFEILRANTFCTIKVGSDQRHAVRIFFGDTNTNLDTPDATGFERTTYIPLWVELQMDGYSHPVIDSQVTVSLDVYQLSETLELISNKRFASGSVTFKVGAKPQAAVIDAFLPYSYTFDVFRCDLDPVDQPDSLRFGITATISPKPFRVVN